jgi:hypothetical protein
VKRILPALLVLVLAAPAAAQTAPVPPLRGRWDLTFDQPGLFRAGWLEVWVSGDSTLVGRYVGNVGSARPVSHVVLRDGEFRFSIPPQWEGVRGDLRFVGRVRGDSISGTLTPGDGEPIAWTGVRAPSLRREAEPVWGAPVPLLKDGLSGWHVVSGEGRWEVVDGVLHNRGSGGNLATDATFGDFKLHLEFRTPAGSNSGVYLRGRYEVQIEDPSGPESRVEPVTDVIGSVYGFLEPSHDAARPAGQWQSYDITLVGRHVTVVLNGTTVISDREIPGITGGALDSREGTPGPLLLQGDHGAMEFRNLVITPARPGS